MAVTYVTGEARSAEGGGITSLELTTGFSVTGSNRVLIAGVGTSAGTPPDWTNCRWGGSTGTVMTSFGTRTNSVGAYAGIRGFYLKDASIGASALKVYASGAATDECGIVAVAYSGVDQTTTFGTLATAQGYGGGGVISATVTSATGELIVGWHYHASGTVANPTDAASQTRRQTSIGPANAAIIASEKAGAASTTFGYTCSDTAAYGQALQAISLKPAAGGDTALAGAATAGASASGTLTNVPASLGGDAAAGATAVGDLTIGNVIGGGGSLPNELEAAAMASASASGALTTQIKLLAAAVSATTATGSLTTGISLAGSAASVTLASGTLTTQIRLQGAALAAAVAAAGLTTAIRLAAAAQAGAQASGDLTTGGGAAALAGNALAAAIAAGALTTIIRLDGAALAGAIAQGVLAGGAADLQGVAIAGALAAGDLTTAIRLAAAVLAGADSTGALTTQPAGLAADAQAIAIAAGGLTTSIRLAGAAASVVQATGSLDVGVTMQASAFASAMATGVLLTQIRLDAAAVAGALASGYLEGSVPAAAPASRTIPVALELRTVSVAGESRRVPA